MVQCETLSEREADKLEKFVKELNLRGAEGRVANSVANSSQSDLPTPTITANDDLSDLSDDDENLYPDRKEVEEMKFIRLRLNPTSNPKIRQLFSNTDKVISSNQLQVLLCYIQVFTMTRQRGRALIINNMNFEKRPDLCRKGSDVDVENLSTMLKSLKFDFVTHRDLKAEVRFAAVYSSSYKLTPLLVYRCIRNLYT
ncbi:hypothetical protein EB796_000568 [Bugula neritina]|uniref:Caspase family p20 domain-containing protein n=1 Tax=Bugula neritina TaxID=10212 RepID=A0A7J7KSF0_BUGNE|nr:hypothetical protein EB796_000568 [Bugula neritina]